MRKYIRHPSGIPIEVEPEATARHATRALKNVGHGGLSFRTRQRLEPDALVRICVPTIAPQFSTRARVVWCHESEQGFDVGVEFVEQHAVFEFRMVEQICHIEQYRRELLDSTGRDISSCQAAIEWIALHAANFPELDPDSNPYRNDTDADGPRK